MQQIQQPVALRHYQIKLIEDIAAQLQVYHSTVAQAPTGSGKSKVFIAIAKMAATQGTTTLILSETTKIYRQIRDEYPAVNIDPSTKLYHIRPGATYVGMVQTLARRKQLINQFAQLKRNLLVINDEAHIGTSTTLLRQFPDAFKIGFTATPAWKWAKHLSELYQSIAVGPQVSELIQQGFLSPYKHFARVSANLSALRVEKGEYTEESQHLAFEHDAVYDSLVTDLRTIPHRKCIVFTSSIKHCSRLTTAMRIRGVRCVEVHSKLTEAQNAYNMREFQEMRSGVDVCISVGTLTKGFDFPAIDLVVLMRATTSLPLYLQMVGRGSRLSPGKSAFTTLDYGMNWKRFGEWSQDRDWSTLWLPSQSKQRESVAPVKNCPACEYIVPTTRMVCPNCGHHFQRQERESPGETQLIDVTALLRGKPIGVLTPLELAEAAKNNLASKGHAIRVAKAQEQAQPGYLAQFAMAMGYNPLWADKQLQMMGSEPIQFFNKVM